jgi:hypothetical protein
MEATARKTILRIECWHGVLLLALFFILGRTTAIDGTALIAGGLFMGVNFLLLSFGVAAILTPLASKGRVKLGVGLLLLKIIFFLALLTTVFFRFNVDRDVKKYGTSVYMV